MAKQLKINHEGKEYTLEYTRRTVEMMERSGFIISEVKDKPMTALPALFEGAFLSQHPKMKSSTKKAIYKSLRNKEELLGCLAEMYYEPLETLMDEPEEGDEGNCTWTANW